MKKIGNLDAMGEVSVTVRCGREEHAFTVSPGYGPPYVRVLQGIAKAVGGCQGLLAVEAKGFPVAVLCPVRDEQMCLTLDLAKRAIDAYNAFVGAGLEPVISVPFSGRRYSLEVSSAHPADGHVQEDCGARGYNSAGAAEPKFRKEF